MKLIENFDLEQSSKIIKNGGTVVLPFDTVYGIIADPFNDDAIKKLYEIKGRNFNKPIALIFSSLAMLKKYIKVDSDAEKFITEKVPGPYTFIFPWSKDEKAKFAKHYQNFDKVGIRIPNFQNILNLVDALDQPIAATSANISGAPNCWSPDDFINQIKNKSDKPNLLIDGGQLEKNLPSTVIDISSTNDFKILRD